MVKVGDAVLDLFKELIWDAAVKMALEKLFAKVAFLAWGPFGAAITWIVEKYGDELYEIIHTYIDLKLIVFRNKELLARYADASVRLKLAAAGGLDTPEFRKARDEDKIALSNFMRLAVA